MDFEDFINLRGSHRIRASQLGPIQKDPICHALEHWGVVQEQYVSVLANYIKHILSGPAMPPKPQADGLHRIYVIDVDVSHKAETLSSDVLIEWISKEVAQQVFKEHGLWRGIILYTTQFDSISHRTTYLFHFLDVIK